MHNLDKNQVVMRIQARLNELDMSPHAASIKAGQNGLWWGRVAKNEQQWPATDNLYALCEAIGLRMNYVLTGRGARLLDDPDVSEDITLVPRLSWVAAGGFAETLPVGAEQIEEFVPVAGLDSGDYIALDVVGDSMNLIAPDGSTVIANRNDTELVDKKFYVVSTENGGAATFKRFRDDWPPRLEPYSTNPDHKTINIQEPIRVVGRITRVLNNL